MPSKARVLVVEDSPTQRQQLVRELVGRGYEVHEAESGVAALRKLTTHPPDIVVLDVVLDGLDGYSVCRWMRLRPTTSDIAVIMLTVKSEVRSRIDGLHVGADDYVAKPFDLDELEARMDACLRNRKSRVELRGRNAELQGRLMETQRLAMTDALTGIYNRRHFDDVLQREWASALRYKHPLALALIDLDNFKLVNDRDGHSAGDRVIRDVAAIIRASIREVDTCARYGGDEFGILLPHTPASNCSILAERLRSEIVSARAGWPGEASNVGISIGIASNEDDALQNTDHLVEAADRALYHAKGDGRGRTVIAVRGILEPLDP